MANNYIIGKDDDLCRQILLLRDKKCQGPKCTATESLVPSHCYGKKAYPNLRHDPLNLLLLCDKCHKEFWHKYPAAAWTWFEEEWPERYNYLVVAKNRIIKLNEIHYREVAVDLEAELNRLIILDKL
jgi:hypothetical protein